MKYVISSSYGNDSIAMIQWAKEHDLEDVTVVYIDTGWAAEKWFDRVILGEDFSKSCGFDILRITPDVKFIELMKLKKGFPNQRFQWCSGQLKGIPFLNWVDKADPQIKSIVMIGKRRQESAARSCTPEFVESSDYHGGRKLWHPLYLHTVDMRNDLLKRAGFEPLPHRSLECDPCVNSNRADFRRLSPIDINKTEELEKIVGKNMFRPAKHGNAQGIQQVIHWAKYSSGQYNPDQDDLFNEGCGSPFGCGL